MNPAFHDPTVADPAYRAMDSLKVGDQFASIDAARDAIRRFTLDDGESFRVIASDKKRYIISCKAASTGCGFEFEPQVPVKELPLLLSLSLILVVLLPTTRTDT